MSHRQLARKVTKRFRSSASSEFLYVDIPAAVSSSSLGKCSRHHGCEPSYCCGRDHRWHGDHREILGC